MTTDSLAKGMKGRVSLRPVRRLGMAAITVVALVAAAAPPPASAENGCSFCATRSRADGRAGIDTIPRAGTGSVTLLGATSASARDADALATLSLMLGLPFYTAIHVELPAAFAGTTDVIGSPAISGLAYLGLDLPGAVILKIVAAVGVASPAIDAEPLDVGLYRASADTVELRSRVAASLIHPSRLALSVHYEREGSRHEAGATAGYVSRAAGWSIHAGLVGAADPMADPTASYWAEAALTYRPRWAPRWGLTVFGGANARDLGSRVVGLSLSYSFPFLGSATDPGEHLIGTSGTATVLEVELEDGRHPLERVAVPGKITIVAFKTYWCTACRHLNADLRRIAAENPEVVLVFLDADDLEEMFAFNGGVGLPLVVVFDARGREIGRTASNVNAIEEMLRRGVPAAADDAREHVH